MTIKIISHCCQQQPTSGPEVWTFIAPILSVIIAGLATYLAYKVSKKNVNMANFKLINDRLNWLKQDTYDIVAVENGIQKNIAARNIAEQLYNKATYLLLEFEDLFDLAQRNSEDKAVLTQQIQFLYRVMYRDRLTTIYDQSLTFHNYPQNQALFGLGVLRDYLFTFVKADKKLGI